MSHLLKNEGRVNAILENPKPDQNTLTCNFLTTWSVIYLINNICSHFRILVANGYNVNRQGTLIWISTVYQSIYEFLVQ